MAEGDAFHEEDSHCRTAVVEGTVQADVLHRVLYPQVHENVFKKKNSTTPGRVNTDCNCIPTDTAT